jgi:fimbrial chaperone protein
LACLSLALVTIGTAHAGSFGITPVRLDLRPGERTAAATLTNRDAKPVSVRVSVLRWTQENGEDKYAPTKDVLVSPPIFTIPAGEAQIVRVGLRHPQPGSNAAYRVIFEEIPSAAAANAKSIRITLNLNLPLYVLAEPEGQAALTWSAWRDSSGAVTLQARNAGNAPVQITEIKTAAAGKTTLLSREMGVVLPASARNWHVGKQPMLAAGTPIQLSIRTPRGEKKARLVLQGR